jgi:hypothetical protein
VTAVRRQVPGAPSRGRVSAAGYRLTHMITNDFSPPRSCASLRNARANQRSIECHRRRELEAVVANRNSPQKPVGRAKNLLLTADGHGTTKITRATGKAKTVIWRSQEWFGQEA